MIASHEKEIEEVEKKVPEAELYLDRMAQQVHTNLFKFKNFHDQMNFTSYQCLAITNATIDLIDLSRGFDVAKKLPRQKKIEDDAIVFYEEDKQILYCCHNRSLYSTAFVHTMLS